MAKQKMGELLIRAGLIKETDLRVALAQQKTHGGRLGEHLIRMHLLDEGTLAHALAQQLGLAFNDMSVSPLPAIANLLPEKVAMRLQALPVALDARSGVLSVAVGNPLEEAVLKEVARITNKIVVPVVAPVNLLRRGIEHAYFGVEVHDEGTSEFQLVDIHGRGKKVYVGEEANLPELGTAELMPIGEDELDDSAMGGEHAAISDEVAPLALPKPAPMRISPIPPKPAPGAAPRAQDAGEEALRTVMALADLLIERGYFTRAELMRQLRK